LLVPCGLPECYLQGQVQSLQERRVLHEDTSVAYTIQNSLAVNVLIVRVGVLRFVWLSPVFCMLFACTRLFANNNGVFCRFDGIGSAAFHTSRNTQEGFS